MINKAEQQPAYVLHRRPYRESSFLIDAFTCNFGRVSFVANGAKKPGKSGILQPFQPLLISWSGKSSLKTMTHFELSGSPNALTGLPFYCAYYLNELVLYSLPEGQAYEWVFAQYIAALQNLSDGEDVYLVLRRFEFILLRELGVLMALNHDEQGAEINPAGHYRVTSESTLQASSAQDARSLPGAMLMGLSQFLDGDHDLMQSLNKEFQTPLLRLSRDLLGRLLDGRPLKSKDMLRQYRSYAN